ncbi:MAG TPA: redoxin domain-containing protein, partial [Gemmataceae bacterium]|nr:redoxin domain-containing protein [Gemmataceae bacterium]
MVELGQLEKQHAEFDAKGVRIVAVSLDDVAETAKTQQQFPHLTVLSDHEQSLARAADVIGTHHGPSGETTVSPTTVLIDGKGKVRWVFRPDRYIT